MLARGGGANPAAIVKPSLNWTVLMQQCYEPGLGRPSAIARLLADARVVAQINAQSKTKDEDLDGYTALYMACNPRVITCRKIARTATKKTSSMRSGHG